MINPRINLKYNLFDLDQLEESPSQFQACQHLNQIDGLCEKCGMILESNDSCFEESDHLEMVEVKSKKKASNKTSARRSCRKELDQYMFPSNILDMADEIYCSEFKTTSAFRKTKRDYILITCITEAYYRSGNPQDPRLVAVEMGKKSTCVNAAITTANNYKMGKENFECTYMTVIDYVKCYFNRINNLSEDLYNDIVDMAKRLVKNDPLLSNNNLYTLAAGILSYCGQVKGEKKLDIKEMAKVSNLSQTTIGNMITQISASDNN